MNATIKCYVPNDSYMCRTTHMHHFHLVPLFDPTFTYHKNHTYMLASSSLGDPLGKV